MNRIHTILIISIVAALLLIPLFGNYFVHGWNWSVLDFLFGGVFLYSAGVLISFVLTRAYPLKYTIIGISAVVVVFTLIWVELAVGIFDGNESSLEKSVEINSSVPSFVWRYEKANSLNGDGISETNVYIEVSYPSLIVKRKLIDTVASSCNDLTDTEADSVSGSKIAQCYGAGLGYRFKIIKGESSYLVLRKKFEEALPNQSSSNKYEYEVVAEIPLNE